MNCKDIEDVKRIVKETNISFIQFWFTDVLGFLKSFAVAPSELDDGLTEGMGFDGSSIEGFARIQESDMIAKPDPTTFQLVPWRSKDRPVARMFCDILNPDGTPYVGDPRYAFKRNLERIKKKGYTFYLGPELEFFFGIRYGIGDNLQDHQKPNRFKMFTGHSGMNHDRYAFFFTPLTKINVFALKSSRM